MQLRSWSTSLSTTCERSRRNRWNRSGTSIVRCSTMGVAAAAVRSTAVPDTLASHVAGYAVILEFKVPGKEPNDQQWLRIHDLREAGITAWYVTSVEEYEMMVGLRPSTIRFVYPPRIRELVALGTSSDEAKGHGRAKRR